MTKKLFIMLAVLGMSLPVVAGELSPKSEALLPLCASCHGIDGTSSVDLYPNLAGQKSAYIIKQLTDFRAKIRDNEIMGPMAEPLDDASIKELAEYFSTRKK